ncbi:DNA replication and repair protein RadC [Chitinasiproducens palmae]|uniref:DNA replication and repair protein RadC n=1 Tax=Chitinasiproducens palmae TaxID=1770053 RepID=A0A1H2PS43_9BURK|nr:DNA replication and repair protein RadC [Chitinasiproducens palmae]
MKEAPGSSPGNDARHVSAAARTGGRADRQESGIVSQPAKPCARRGPGADLPISRWPVDLRPRERLQEAGPGALSNAELLALLLGSGPAHCNAVAFGQALLARFGSLRALLHADRRVLAAVRGMGPAKLSKLQAVLQLVERALVENLRADAPFAGPANVKDYLRLTLGMRSREIFMCLYLDARHRLIASEEASRGTLTQTAVYPREIVREALMRNAVAVIVAHNHPSGQAAPSEADQRLTYRLKAALELMDVRLLDHMIVTHDSVMSFAERGWL